MSDSMKTLSWTSFSTCVFSTSPSRMCVYFFIFGGRVDLGPSISFSVAYGTLAICVLTKNLGPII